MQHSIANICYIWLGMILGISFLEAWAKFKSQIITRQVALDVGRTVFSYFHKAQIFLLIIIISLGLLSHLTLMNWIVISSITFIFFLQVKWLFAKLWVRVSLILKGDNPPPSAIHLWYIAAEIIKCVLLVLLASSL